ncbi:MAG: alpha/beta fold hydrolase [Dehalococcoidia bacterium]|jgi:class 3 adenylate cyclase
MEQQIRFCTTSDGVRIAYATVGQGPPLVRIMAWFTHLEVEWENPLGRYSIDACSRFFRLIRYDGRGMGLSDRQVNDYSLEAQLRDLEAVVDDLGLDRFALHGISQGGATAIAYAVRHPDRVTHLILYGSYARMSWALDTQEGRQGLEAMLTLIRQGWDSDLPAYRQFFTSLFMPDADPESIRQFNELQRVSTSAENAAALISAMAEIDVRHLLPQVTVPTLVAHRRGDTMVPFGAGRELATGIPGARFLPMQGRSHTLLPGDPVIEAGTKAIAEFVGVSERSEAVAAPSGPLTILFTDIEGSTALTERLGDAKAREVLRNHDRIVREALRAHGGAEVKAMGDGFMASFSSAARALECAIALQRAFAAHDDEHPETPIRVRMGLNAGEPIAEDEDLFGTAVILAARIAAQAKGKEILASDVVRQLVAGKGFLFADRGEVVLRGFEDPVRLYELRWEGPP